jgi:mono/diheme cytochrome c family protein
LLAALLALWSDAAAAPDAPGRPDAHAALRLLGNDRLSSLQTHLITVANDRVYKRAMRYQAWALSDVLALLPDVADRALRDDAAITFIASDGYRATEPLLALWNQRRRGYLAFRDVRAGGERWKSIRVGKSQTTPAPYYLVWTGADDPSLPWPYQLVAMEVAPISEIFADALPGDPAARPGFEVFRANCMSCHSVNLTGGSVGPELNVPRNVTEYWVPGELAPYIRNAGAYRFRSHMPAFDSLTDEQIADVVRYLRALKAEKVCRSPADCERFARSAKK